MVADGWAEMTEPTMGCWSPKGRRRDTTEEDWARAGVMLARRVENRRTLDAIFCIFFGRSNHGVRPFTDSKQNERQTLLRSLSK